jgi:hypothetical protein
MAARLSASAAARPSGSPRVRKPPRHRLDTCSPAARTAAALALSPVSATRSRHSPIAGMSCRTHSATASASPRCLTVAWFSESRSIPIPPTPPLSFMPTHPTDPYRRRRSYALGAG